VADEPVKSSAQLLGDLKELNAELSKRQSLTSRQEQQIQDLRAQLDRQEKLQQELQQKQQQQEKQQQEKLQQQQQREQETRKQLLQEQQQQQQEQQRGGGSSPAVLVPPPASQAQSTEQVRECIDSHDGHRAIAQVRWVLIPLIGTLFLQLKLLGNM